MMKKLIARLLLFFIVFSQLQVGDLYVSAKQDILSTQNNSIQELEQFEQAFDTSIKKVDKKLKNKKKKQKLKQKQKEIKQLMKDAKKQLKKENNKEKIKKIKQDTKNRALLKMTSGVLDYKNIEENLKGDLKNNKKKKQKALKTLKKSLKKNNAYSVMLSGDFSKKELVEKYKAFDEKIKVKKLYKKGEKTYFLITFRKNSILQEELFENIESGELPDNFLGLEVVQPEIFTIDSLDLQGENLFQTWGVEQYATYTHFDNLDTSKKLRVGIIDTGIDPNHSDLQANVVTGYDFINNDNDANDDQGHGTHVAGTVGANINGGGIVGVNPYVDLVPLKICDENGMCPSYAITQAIAYADENNIDVINMSLGGRTNPVGHAICDGITTYSQNGGIAVVAAGNNNIDASQFVPGGCSKAITVGAVGQNNQKAVFSNYGNSVDVVAPGTNIYSTSLNNSYKELSGTSMASPHITGVVSLLSQSGIAHDRIDTVLKNYTDANKLLDITSLFENEVVSLNSGNPSNEAPDEGGNTHNDNDENKDEATINPNIVFIKNQEELDKQKFEYPEVEEPTLTNSTPKNQIIDFGNESIVTNNIGETTEIIDIEETLESKKEFFTPGDKYFNADGEISAQDFEVNSIDQGKPIKSYKVDENFDYKNIDFSQYDFSYEKEEDIEINNLDESINQDYLINGNINYTSQTHNYTDPIIFTDNEKLNNFSDDLTDNDYVEEIKINNVLECNIYVDGLCEFRLRKGRRYNSFTSTGGIVSLSNSKRILYITGKQVGTTQVTYKDDYGRIKIDVLVTVKEKPAPITYDYDVSAGAHINISFPESISRMSLDITGTRIYDDLDKEGNYLSIDTYTVGEQTFTLTDQQNDIRYIINVVSKPQINTYNVYKTDKIETRQNDNYNETETNRDIVEYYVSRGDGYIHAKNIGYGEIQFFKDRGLRRIFKVTVNPIPEPTEIICNVVVGDRCKFNIKNGGHIYTESKFGVIEMKDRKRTVGLRTHSSGQATVYVKSPTGDYFTHILKINVSPEPPIIKTCETPQGLACETKRYNRDENYTFAVSQEGIVNLRLVRYWLNGERTDKETLYIEGLQEGTVDVYLYKNGDHVYTFQTTILPAVTPIYIEDKIIKLKQTENQITQVSGGGGEYRVEGENLDIAYVDVDKYTGELDVSARNPGSYYPIVTDKYDQKESFKVVVEDVQLILDTYEVELKVGERQYVHIYESYYGVQLSKTNDNIRAYRTSFTNGDKAITIVGEQPGTTVLEVTDSEGNLRTVNVTVTGTAYNPDPGTDPDPGTGSGSTEPLEPELQSILDNFDYAQISTEGYVFNLFEPYLAYIPTVEITSSNENFDINSLLDDYNEYRYNNSWESYAEHLTNFIIYHRPEYEIYASSIKESINTNTKTYAYNQVAINHPDTNEILIENTLGLYLPKIQYREYLNGKLYLTSRQKEINYLNSRKNAYIYTLERAIDEYWKNNPTELEQREQEEFQELMDSFGLLNAGQAWGAIASTVKAEIENDPYLADIAKEELIQELEQLSTEYTSIEGLLLKKFRFLGKLAGFQKKTNLAKQLGKSDFIKTIKYDNTKLQKKYDAHAEDFGIFDNFNVVNREKFKDELNKHINLEGTIMKTGTHRSTQNVQHFYNPDTNINVMYDTNGNFVSGWKLGQSQIDNLLRNGNIQ